MSASQAQSSVHGAIRGHRELALESAAGGLRSAQGQPMALSSVSAQGTLNGLMFVLAVEQRYHNTTSRTLETVYTFPLSWDAVLLGMEFHIGDKALSGVVTGKRQAEEQYEEAIAAGDTAVMVEKSVNGLYTVNLGNLKPAKRRKSHTATRSCCASRETGFDLASQPRSRHATVTRKRDGGVKPHESVQADLLVEYPFEISIDIIGDAAAGSLSPPSHSTTTAHTASGATVNPPRGAFLDRDFILVIEDLRDAPSRRSPVMAKVTLPWRASVPTCPARRPRPWR